MKNIKQDQMTYQLKREITHLYQLGLTEDEVRYLVHMKKKQIAREHWRD